MKKLAIDTFYIGEDKAYTVGIGFNDWADSSPLFIIDSWYTEKLEPYIPGEFYKRELPCILGLLGKIKIEEFDTLLIDGLVRTTKGDGLGAKLGSLFPALEIIGVAKTKFQGAEYCEVIRGKHGTTKPLYVQALHMPNYCAGTLIKNMHGEYRIPTLLKILDKETKKKW